MQSTSCVYERSVWRELRGAQSQAVGYHEHAGKGHRQAGPHRIQETECRDRYRCRVVHERPEHIGADGSKCGS